MRAANIDMSNPRAKAAYVREANPNVYDTHAYLVPETIPDNLSESELAQRLWDAVRKESTDNEHACQYISTKTKVRGEGPCGFAQLHCSLCQQKYCWTYFQKL